VHLTFGIVSITGPVLGVVVGGNVTSCLGGFRSKKSLLLAIGIAIMCVVSAAPIPFLTNFWAFIVFLWFLLFFGGFNMPAFSGMMLECVDNKFKATGNAIANLSYNLIGFLPAPSVYGFVYEYGEGGNARAAMATLMFTPILSFTFVMLAACLIIKNDTLGYKKAQ
jgi:MFS family permease